MITLIERAQRQLMKKAIIRKIRTQQFTLDDFRTAPASRGMGPLMTYGYVSKVNAKLSGLNLEATVHMRLLFNP